MGSKISQIDKIYLGSLYFFVKGPVNFHQLPLDFDNVLRNLPTYSCRYMYQSFWIHSLKFDTVVTPIE